MVRDVVMQLPAPIGVHRRLGAGRHPRLDPLLAPQAALPSSTRSSVLRNCRSSVSFGDLGASFFNGHP